MIKLKILLLLLLLPATAWGWGVHMYGGGVEAPAGGVPELIGEVAQARLDLSSGTATTTIAVDAVAQGSTVVVLLGYYSGVITVSSITDDQGNTYTLDVTDYDRGTNNIVVASGYVDTALASGDDIIITWSASTLTYKLGTVVAFSGVSSTGQPDTTGFNATFSASPTASATVGANSVQAGIIYTNNDTYSGMNTGWTILGEVDVLINRNTNWYYFTGTNEDGGAFDPGGTISVAESYIMGWASYD